MRVQVIYALPERVWSEDLELPAGATVSDAIRGSGILEAAGLPTDFAGALGVWGEVVDGNRRLREGDRVEIYRPLHENPRVARRRLAESEQARRRRR